MRVEPLEGAMQTAAQLRRLYAACEMIRDIPGDFAECGVAGGVVAEELCRIADEMGHRHVHLFDAWTLPGGLGPGQLPSFDDRVDGGMGEERTAARQRLIGDGVVEHLARIGNAVIHRGLFRRTMPGFRDRIAFVHVDADYYYSTLDACVMLNRCAVRGAVVVVHDYGNPTWPGVIPAVEHALRCDEWTLIQQADNQGVFRRWDGGLSGGDGT